MPQMMPIYWLIILLLNTLMLMLMIVEINSFFKFSWNKSSPMLKKVYDKKFNTKWD